MKRTTGYACLLAAAAALTLTPTACGDDDGPLDSGPAGHDGAQLDGAGREGGQKDSKAPPPGFDLEVTIDVDSKLPCNAGDSNKDCVGQLIWGIWPKPATSADPGPALYLGYVPDGKKGTTFKATNIPGANKMYLNLFLDDNGSATPAKPLWDKGDLLHLDLAPFTAVPGQTIKRTITLWVRVP